MWAIGSREPYALFRPAFEEARQGPGICPDIHAVLFGKSAGSNRAHECRLATVE